MEFKDSYECVGFNTIFIKEERISDEELNGFVKVEATDEAVDPLQLDTGCSSTIPPPPSLVELGGKLRTCDGFTPTDKSSNSADSSVTKNSNVCEFCGESFYDEYTLRTHITEHNRDESNLCQICGEIFPNKSYYTAHFETCSSKSILFQRLTMRMNVEKPFKCESCFKVFSSKKYLSAHIKTHTKKRFICEFCNREFLKRRDFNNHIKTHKQNQEDFKCDFCNKCFESQSSFILHVRIHTNNVHLVCNFCNKTFLQKSHLSDHIIKTHKVSNKPTFFKCDFCKKFFSKEEGLKIHMAKVHNKDEGYKCEFECCNKILSNKESLKNHVAIHTKGDVIPSQTKLVTNSTQTDEILVPDIDSVSIELDTNSRDNVLL